MRGVSSAFQLAITAGAGYEVVCSSQEPRLYQEARRKCGLRS